MVAFLVMAGIGLVVASICTTVIIAEQLRRFHFRSEFAFAMTYGLMCLGWMMAVIFIANTCAFIAKMS